MNRNHISAPHKIKIKKQTILPLLTILIGTVITIMALVAYKNYEEKIMRSKLKLNARGLYNMDRG